MRPITKLKEKSIYLLVFGLAFIAISFLSLIPDLYEGVFILMSLLILGLGTVHVYTSYEYFPELDRAHFSKGWWFTLITSIWGALLTLLILFYVAKPRPMGLHYAWTVLFFPLPFLLHWSFESFLKIPGKEFRLWHFPESVNVPDLDMVDLSNVIVVQLIFFRNAIEKTATNFKAKAPLGMPLKDLFMIFVEDYNEKHAKSMIEYRDKDSQPHGWLFYKKAPWWRRRFYFDPNLTFRESQINDNDSIIATRG